MKGEPSCTSFSTHTLCDDSARPTTQWTQRLVAARKVLSQRLDPASGDLGKGSISLAEAGSPRPAHSSVLATFERALVGRDSVKLERYYSGSVLPELMDASQTYFREQLGAHWVESDNICIGAGVCFLLDAACYACIGPKDIVLTCQGFYHAFAEYPKKWGATMEVVGSSAEDEYKLRPDAIRTWFKENPEKRDRVKLFLVTNPTVFGALYTSEEVEELSETAEEFGVCIFSDEIYADSVYRPHKIASFSASTKAANRCIVAHSGSKTRGIADLRVGWACGPKEVIERMRHFAEYSLVHVPTLTQVVATSALAIPDTYLHEDSEECRLRSNLIISLLGEWNDRMKAKYNLSDDVVTTPIHPKAGHGLLVSFPGLPGLATTNEFEGSTSLELASRLMNPMSYGLSQLGRGVALGPGWSLGLNGTELRICFSEVPSSGCLYSDEAGIAGDQIFDLPIHRDFHDGRLSLVAAINRICQICEAQIANYGIKERTPSPMRSDTSTNSTDRSELLLALRA